MFYDGETYFDLKSFINAFDGIEKEELIAALHNLIVMNRINPERNTMQGYSGLSLLAMQKDYLDKVTKYSHLRFFQEFSLEPFFRHMVTLINNKKEK